MKGSKLLHISLNRSRRRNILILSLKEGLGRDMILQHNRDLMPCPQAMGQQHKVSQDILAKSGKKVPQEKTGKDSAKELLLSLP